MEKKWFVFADQLVRGPLSTENVEEGLLAGRWTIDTLIWWKGQNQWISIANWRIQLPQLTTGLDRKKVQVDWYLESKGTQTGPMSRDDLLKFLKSSPNPFQFSLWSPGLPDWKKLYFFEEILSELGMSRRQFPRAPLSGAAEITKQNHKFILQATDIGAGGMGLDKASGLTAGYNIQLTIRSPVFPNPIRSNAQILYVKPNGQAGVKFANMHLEAQSSIVEYVKQFEDAEKNQPTIALPKKKDVA
ncbi:MAG: PilZ domain-containing protein [Bdellovibrionia bacterium]